jgi:hypothetical protein
MLAAVVVGVMVLLEWVVIAWEVTGHPFRVQRLQRLGLLIGAAVVVVVQHHFKRQAQAAPVSLSSSTPLLAKPSLYSKARLRGNVLLV